MSDVQAPIFQDIEAAMRRGDVPAAIGLARAALDTGLAHPVLFNLRAHWHEDAGRLPEAVADLERGLRLAPNDPRLLLAIGRCLLRLGRLRPAAEAFEQAARTQPARAEAHYQLGFAREQLGELDAAWASYTRAAELEPKLDDAPARLAGLAARRGDAAEARRLADQALALNPKSATAAFAHIVADLSEGRFAAAGARASAIAADPEVVPQARANALSFAADAADGEGRAAQAFALYRKANDALKTLFRPQFEARETGRPLTRRLTAEFEAIPAAAWTKAASGRGDDESADLVFLLGFPRSGTTLLGQIMGRHPRVAAIEEKPLLREALHAFVDTPGGLARLAALSSEEIARHRAAFWRNVRALGIEPQGRIVVDQSPFNTLHLPVIAKLFPQSRVVFALRDPRDVVLSCFRRLFAMTGYLYEFLSLDGTARFYGETMSLADRCREGLGLEWLDLRNEDLVADFEGQTRRLCAFAGLEWDTSLRDFAKAKARIATPSAMQLGGGLSSDGVGRWKAYADELAPVLPLIAPWVERFGYA